MTLENVKVINFNKTINNADVIIENNKIKQIIEKDGDSNKILIPGFINTHIHGFVGKDAMDSTEAVEMIASEIAKYGTTSFLPTIMTAEWSELLSAAKNVSTANSKGANILGIHCEGPFISVAKKGAHVEKHIIKPTKEKLNELQTASAGMIKKMTFAPEVFTPELIKEMLDLGMTPTIGHTNATALQTHEAVNNGATAATHLWNAMSSVVNRDAGAVEAVLLRDEVYAELIVDLIHVDKQAIDLSIKTKGFEKIVVVSDAIRPAGLEDGPSNSGGFDVVKKGDLITIKGTDTIAGSGSTILQMFRNLLYLGYSLEEAVAMTSYNATQNLNLKNIGQIKEGFNADLVLLNKELDIEKVIINGKEI